MVTFEVVEIDGSEIPTVTLRLPKVSNTDEESPEDRMLRYLRANLSSLVELYNDYPSEPDILFYSSNWLISLSVNLRESIRKVLTGK